MKSILIVSIISILFFVGLIVSDATNGAEVIELHNSGTLEKSDIKGFIKIKKSSFFFLNRRRSKKLVWNKFSLYRRRSSKWSRNLDIIHNIKF